MVRCVVGADVPGGPRGRGRPRRRPLGAARRGRRALPCVRHGAMRCVVGADVPAARVAVFGMVRCVVGADVLGGPRSRVRHGAVRGRGRRPRRPAWSWVSSAAFLGRGAPRTSRPTRCAHARCAHGVRVRRAVCVCGMVRCVVGADVLGGPRAVGVLGGVPWARRASLPCIGFRKNGQKCCTKGGSGLPRPPSCEIMASTPNPKGRR